MFRKANRVLLFHSLPDEVCTHKLIEQYKQSKTLLLPTVVGSNLELHVYDDSTPTTTGAFNITESLGPLFPPSSYHTIDLAIIPGVAFDPSGHRLGRGRGYYDRLLPQLHCPTIGICFHHQLIPTVPTLPHDIPVSEVITSLIIP